ncbi:MAG: cytochrome c maturation protein CcmE, partial [Betaproteobacteria bacterium]
MKPRHKRLVLAGAAAAAVALAGGLILVAFESNIQLFFSPTQVVAGEAPLSRTFRIGGLVEQGSVKRAEDGVTVRFAVTDTARTIPVAYKGIL